ncbi:bifunctional tetrahydrofolate synthase/dihydrofolate synthase [Sinimarinibacterium sp. NLF-5-8]|nr:bifunctional tetrahydrofolate synthase/dihydrofolate synthase [Sinimarinibacterium sp. NLF-5-8]
MPESVSDSSRSLADWLHWQQTLHSKPIELGLARVRAVAERLNLLTPRALTVTVGGTNGKGSSSTLAAKIYQAAGYKVGLYTSPHLLDYNERVQVNGVTASDARLCAAFADIEAARADIPLTYFEFGTLAALWVFAHENVDVQVLEVGLGGRLDAVNIIDADAAIVTSIGLDHVDFLGHDREAIGFEKAGIFRAQRAAIVGDLAPPQSLLDHARAIGADLQVIRQHFAVHPHGDGFDWENPGQQFKNLPLPGIAGEAQLRNAACVIAAVQALQARAPVGMDALCQALPALRLPGRCDQRGRWIFDVAHNREAATVLADFLAQTPKVLTIGVLGMLHDKPQAQVIQTLSAQIDAWVLVSLPGARGTAAAQLAAQMPRHARVRCCETMQQAMAEAEASAGEQGRIVVTGSFLTVAAALAEFRIAD